MKAPFGQTTGLGEVRGGAPDEVEEAVVPDEVVVDADVDVVADSAELVVMVDGEELETAALERSLPVFDVFDAASVEVPVFAEFSAADVTVFTVSVGTAGSWCSRTDS